MKEIISCDICGLLMRLEKRLGDGKTIKGGKYRRRRFKCEICNHTKLINAEGSYDEEIEPKLAIEEAKKLYK
jgi:hypothetical protein